MTEAAVIPLTEAAVVGGGPAGLAAAEVLAQAGHAVTVYDRMPSLGRKFLLAGNGGLNLTHSEPLDRFLAHYPDPAMAGAVRGFPPAALREWADGLGQPSFVGSSGRVFPQAFKATPLLRAWLGRLGHLGVQVRTRHRWTGWEGGTLCFDTPDGPARAAPALTVFALGGASWPRLGSDGGWTAAIGAPVSPLRPANCGFLCAWSPVFRERFQGEPLKRIAATFQGRTIRGEAMITADGIEGGVIYALSAALRDAIDAEGAATLVLDLRPDLDPASLAAKLGGPGISTANALRRAGLTGAAAGLVREPAAPSSPLLPLAGRIKQCTLRLTGTRPIARAISSAGGVRFGGLDGFMLSARPGVFLAGEMLDWEAPTGGYLLQGCFSSGRAAAAQAVEWAAERASRR